MTDAVIAVRHRLNGYVFFAPPKSSRLLFERTSLLLLWTDTEALMYTG